MPRLKRVFAYTSSDPLNYSDPSGKCRSRDVEFKVWEGDMSSTVTMGPTGGPDYLGCNDTPGVICDSLKPIVDFDNGGIPTHQWSSRCRPKTGPSCLSSAGAAQMAGGALEANPMFWFAQIAGNWVGRPIDLQANHGIDRGQGCYGLGGGAMLALDLAIPIDSIGSVPGRVPASAAGALSADIIRLADSHLTRSGETVLGHYADDYIGFARSRGASYFDIGDAYYSLSPELQWAANRRVLDAAIDNGDRITLATNRLNIRPGSTRAREIEYLTGPVGRYQWLDDLTLVPGG